VEAKRRELIERAKNSTDKILSEQEGSIQLFSGQLEMNLKKIQSEKALERAEEIIENLEKAQEHHSGLSETDLTDDKRAEILAKMEKIKNDSADRHIESKKIGVTGEEQALSLLESNVYTLLEEFFDILKRSSRERS
jgi:hypothetical protein